MAGVEDDAIREVLEDFEKLLLEAAANKKFGKAKVIAHFEAGNLIQFVPFFEPSKIPKCRKKKNSKRKTY